MDSPVFSRRHALSSPTYEREVECLSQEQLQAFDALDAQFSQTMQRDREISSWNLATKPSRTQLILDALSQGEPSDPSPNHGAEKQISSDEENPFSVGFRSASSLPGPSTGFIPAFQLASNLPMTSGDVDEGPSSSPSDAVEPGFSSRPNADVPIPVVGFQKASFLAAAVTGTPDHADGLPTGFVKASKRGGWLEPSTDAIEKAKKKMRVWEQDDENTNPIRTVESPKAPKSFAVPSSNCSSPGKRPAFTALQNSPGTPTPIGFGRPSAPHDSLRGAGKARPFKSPLIRPPTSQNQPPPIPSVGGSKLNPRHGSQSGFISASAASRGPTTAAFSSPLRAFAGKPPSSFTTPVRPTNPIPRRHTPAKFVTPFKNGARPMQPLRTPVQVQVVQPAPRPPEHHHAIPEPPKRPRTYFDLTPRKDRSTLQASGLRPQAHSTADLNIMGVPAEDLARMTPTNAIFYSFHTASNTLNEEVVQATPVSLGPAQALEELHRHGCDLATQPWVDNHWCLILWKLAGMVTLDPKTEGDPSARRWCWKEVIRQLLYRYERELNGSSRPPLRLISTQDAPSTCPMVLCISNITWTDVPQEDGTSIPHPELEVTDGWYRLRAQVDESLARAVRRGIIRVGRKIAVAGARLESERKDPMEILEAYNIVKLIIPGNSSHLAAWHSKLGFQSGPYISTLHSLSPDGGLVTAMDLVIVKAYPVAFIEFIEDEDGNQIREGPHSEKDEEISTEKWSRRREAEASKLRLESDKKWSRYEGYADRLMRKAAGRFKPNEDDDVPDHIDNLYDELEDPMSASAVMSKITPSEAGWLAQLIHANIVKEKESASDEMQRELDTKCPPRKVRNFRIVIVQDARTRKRPANRTAQLTVWDVLSLELTEGGRAGSFESGQRFMVTNLMPTQLSAWMDREPGSEVMMATRRDSRWRKIKT
ncbi:hypothetical protein HGRIS_008287 [Hohenbuehelia grisea]|uniref:BRCA2 OB1 domain-containing protein n=1 Tax=Hohenbuehelia grisea TaxID=104357 RepID=A0ABR3J7P2_9AGAR